MWAVGCDRCLLPAVGRTLTAAITVLRPTSYYGGAKFEVVVLSDLALVIIAVVYLPAPVAAIFLLKPKLAVSAHGTATLAGAS